MPENAVHATAGSGAQIGYKSYSSSAKTPGRITIGPDISVDATAAPGTTSDYNDFIFDADGTAAYT